MSASLGIWHVSVAGSPSSPSADSEGFLNRRDMIRHQPQGLGLEKIDGVRGNRFRDDSPRRCLFHDQFTRGVIELKQLIDSHAALVPRATTFPAAIGFEHMT